MQASVHEQERSAYARKAPALFAAIAAVLAAVIAVVALVVVLAKGDGKGGGEEQSPKLAGAAPTNVRLRDRGSSISVNWTDPANGTTQFIISLSTNNAPFQPFQRVNPGQTSFTLEGLNPGMQYCVTVVAVYSATEFATSDPVCTTRTSKSPG